MKTKKADALVKGDVIFIRDFPTWGMTVKTVEITDTHDWHGTEMVAIVNGTLKRDDGKTFDHTLTYVLPSMVTLK